MYSGNWGFFHTSDRRESDMDDEWALNDVLHKDCLMTSTALDESDFGLDLNIDSDTFLLDECMGRIVKAEPADETSDYNGSSSGSPSSSLSSPINMKDEPLGLDINFCVPFTNNFSPASSSHSPFGGLLACANGNSQASPLPPVTHFSQMHPQGGLIGGNSNGMHPHHFMNNSIMFRPESLLFEGVGESSPSPPSSDRSSPMDNAKVVNMMYEAMHPNAFDGFPSGVMNGLAAAHQQLKSRSKMHEMAVKQKLITDQDPRSQGSVQLSAEERRTLVQEGYPIPIRLPLSKSEEEALKIVRRKIKNKLSAQESRRKRKEYMDALESRVQGFINENTHLKSRLRQLEQTNKQLLMKVRVYEQTGNANGTELDPSVLRQ